MRGASLVTLVVLCGRPDHARANPFDLYGSGAVPLAQAGSHVAAPGDVHSAFYNPAALARLRRFELLIAAVAGFPSLSLELDGRTFEGDYLTVDRTTSTPTAKLAPDGISDVDFTAQQVDPAAGSSIGIAGPLGPRESLLGRIAFGVLLYVPFAQVLRERFGRAQDPYFLDYEDRALRLMIIVAVAGEIIRDRLWIGAAMNILADSDAAIETLPAPSTRLDLVGRAAFNAGVLYSPFPRLRIGFCFRDQLSVTAHSEIFPLTAQQGLELETVNPISRDSTITVQTLFSPRIYSLGAAYDWTERLTTSLEINVVDWSSYVPPFAPPMEIHQVGAPQNQCVAANNECIRNKPREVAAIRSTTDPGLSPSVVPRAAASWRVGWGLTARGGYAFVPSPVPEQTSVTNILDSHKHLIGLGGGYAHTWGQGTLRAELGGQLQLMHERRFRKDASDAALTEYSRAASGVDREPTYAPNPLAPAHPRQIPEVALSGLAFAVAASVAYDYTL